jgi:hypothetical protein
MRPATKKALLASIEHWKQLEQVESTDEIKIGSNFCDLCKRFGKGCEKYYSKSKSERCPVFASTGFQGCINTPFLTARLYANSFVYERFRLPADKDTKEKLLKIFHEAAKAEREFLESLLPKGSKNAN